MKTYRIMAFDANQNELIDVKMTEQYDMAAAKKFAYEYVNNISTCGIVSTIEVTDVKSLDKEVIDMDF